MSLYHLFLEPSSSVFLFEEIYTKLRCPLITFCAVNTRTHSLIAQNTLSQPPSAPASALASHRTIIILLFCFQRSLKTLAFLIFGDRSVKYIFT